ncbi:iron ABC transporter permease [Streptomyces sp. TP-A0875]|uniref:FecCD family ABC transporter permease n=1 Tax=Streptomyces sp. TP-A0875 TaxID=552354 RepID=UPI0006B62A2C|nr:iron chelate uptake ABC transporter family permease subunit [Streptomyces sp. TP-A0875]
MLVDLSSTERAPAAPAPSGRRAVRAAGLPVCVVLLALLAVASVMVGAKDLSPAQVWHGLFQDTGTYGDAVVGERLSRTVLGLLAGSALGLAGGVLQALTRNPLADPGLLGINAGACAAVVTAITFLGVTSPGGYVWFAFLGAAAVGALVWFLGGGRGVTPVRLVLAGTAIGAVLFGYLQAVMIMDEAALARMRFWTVGSLSAATGRTIVEVLPFFVVGTVLALALARPLNALEMGDDTARALGAHPNRTRGLAMLAATVLCGAATAACGPIVFVGLMVPHAVRSFTGPDLRWILPYAALLAPVLLLGADVLGRIVVRPSELQVGIVTAVLGGPVFLHLVRRRRTVTL